ncbi:hypothetical protein F2Q69_00030535 [Brassica cretica]|uniref:Uncharacterized protein n=1 Tax=Brassica cretica TaxID=69181 RepID=A0A8S9S2W9_BRACR|nr:hypothetical protein F2Q69_00030535 [Brassica cretica]
MLAIALMGMAPNIPLGFWREHTIKFSPSWSLGRAVLAVGAAFQYLKHLRADIIPKLNGFFTTYFPSEATRAISQKADFLCKARIVSVLQQNDWSPVSCTGCSRKFHAKLVVDDGKDTATLQGRRPHRTSTESASETGGPFGKAKEVDDPNLPSLAEIEKSRKRPAF